MKLPFILFCFWCAVTRINAVDLEITTTEVANKNITKYGVCPRIIDDGLDCSTTSAQCEVDSDCENEQKCCNDGCGNICTYPAYTGCQQMQSLLSKQFSSSEDTESIFIPECEDDGKFKSIQCDKSEKCWCVDDLGFELAGTRENSSSLVNCSDPKPCADVLCRMLCPYGFELDADGCPLCRCRNPCQGIECPAGQECQLEDIPCAEDVCPPLPTCKQPRRLEDLCPLGPPLSSPDNGHPFLCGIEPNKPQCPSNYLCDVLPGNDYGVCCPLVDKPGICSTVLNSGQNCGASCEKDMDCEGVEKCCAVENCGVVCTKPANATLCLQQKAVVELLLSGNPGYEGYIPQCLENGAFSPKQCSTNGHLCWCVTTNGTIIAGTMGIESGVECEPHEIPEVQGRTSDPVLSFECDDFVCDKKCEAGYMYNGRGCKTCECIEPCKDVICAEGMECVLMKMDNCHDEDCPVIATCRDLSAECSWGIPLRFSNTSALVRCPENACPHTHICEVKQNSGICCPKKVDIEVTKTSECPSYVHEPSACSHVCSSDSQCDGDMKCCPSKACGAICVPPKPPKIPTMCEYIRDAGVLIERPEGNATLAIHAPQCTLEGAYSSKQCNYDGECWCVDEFGVEIINTRSKSEDINCEKIRDEMSCLGLICRLGCDFGFVMDENGCPLCSCRNPCQNASCKPGKICQFLEVECNDDWCPPLPYCVPAESAARNFPECPVGSPMMYDYDDEPVMCDPFSDYPQCPSTHDCLVNSPREMGVCCPRVTEVVEDHSVKIGQCPYLIPVQSDTCEYQCSSDRECKGGKKCCSNGCGTQCVDPELKTACQHQRSIAEHRAIELGIPASRVFMPNCTASGAFASIQCNPVEEKCWCVTESGTEIPGTRVDAAENITCTPEAVECDDMNCDVYCSNGYETDDRGCPTCKCVDPCKGVKCKNPQESCRLVNVNCITEPCPPVPLCLPKLENPCPVDEPLLHEAFGEYVHCGPEGEQCPSSHRCHLSPFGEYALCCPKPIVSSCEQMKKRNLQFRKVTNRVTFLPKCNKKTGAWDPTQCMESLGLCWCVDPDGNQLPGTLVRGVPHCTARSAKSIDHTAICQDGKPVHICPEDMCDVKFCLMRPNATCRINPCGGCTLEYVDDFNNVVDCNEGLTACFAEVQNVINSGVLRPEDFLNEDLLPSLEEIIEELTAPPTYPPPPPPPQRSGRMKRAVSYDYNYNMGQQNGFFDYDYPLYEDTNAQSFESVQQPFVMVPRIQAIEIKMAANPTPANSDSLMLPSQILEILASDPHVEVLGMSKRFTILDDGLSSRIAKPGSCPVPSLLSIFRSITQGCRDHCSTDFDCPGNAKCCLYNCGLNCVVPFEVATVPIMSRNSQKCPAVHPDFMNPFVCLFAKRPCFSDQDCAENYKCCSTACGAECVRVSEKKVSLLKPVKLQVSAPRCSLEGGFSITQRQGELSWCVDAFGSPLHHTLTRGRVECDSNGTIISQIQTGPVCLNPKQVPRVCKEECLRVSCAQHPEAICVADPCDDCSVMFVSSDGSPVSCEEKCKQPLSVGYCRSSLPRYFYNQTSESCEQFFYGGCQGNDNNFETLQECQEECEKPVPQCEQPKEVGLCRAQIFRWFYNKHTHQCEQFMYGGCGGNTNNFETKEECEITCPDLVICPWINVNGGDITACSKSSACANATCSGRSEALCTVDPCTCEPMFVDKNGERITCLPKDTEVSEESLTSLRVATVVKYTRCERLLKQHLLVGDLSYVPQCNNKGQFYPTQCTQGKDSHCWCVDEVGVQLPGTSTFLKGTKTCKFVKVKAVEVTLLFKHKNATYSEIMKPEIKKLIKNFLADLKVESSEISVNVLPDVTQVAFTLLGDNKVDVAFQIEEMMRLENIFIILPKAEMPVDYKTSQFYHVLDYEVEDDSDNGISANRIEDIAEAGSQYHWSIFLLFGVFGCVILFVVFYLIPLMIRRRKEYKDGEKPKPSLISMVFNNVTYGIVGKKPEDKAATEPPKVVVQTVEAQYDSLKKKGTEDQLSQTSEAPPAYDDVDEKEKTEKPEKH